MSSNQETPLPRKQPGLLRRGLRACLGMPAAWVGYRQIVDGASGIKVLFDAVRRGPGADPRVHVDNDRRLDVEEMAWQAQVPAAEIERQLGNRRRQTYQSTYLYLVGASGLLLLTLYHAITTLVYSLSVSFFVGMTCVFCCFFCMALYNALVNWQIRTLRLGSVWEFINADETWWPSR